MDESEYGARTLFSEFFLDKNQLFADDFDAQGAE